MRILLVEDDTLLGDGIVTALRREQYSVDWFKDGVSALHAATSEHIDLIILDLGLPRMDGIEVLKQLRDKKVLTPVLILTARDEIEDRINGLDTGADDYLVKPFALQELLARIRALHRRHIGQTHNVIEHQKLHIDTQAHSVSVDGQPVNLPRREFALLRQLIENRGTVLSREQLEQSLYAWSDEVGSNTIEVHIHHLRKKLGNDLIRTVRGTGYTIDKTAHG
jgi:two-component system response regulator QseB